jgi:predicted MFS family arabinose efflux permease
MPVSKTTILFIIVLSQFLCTTTWFGGNAVIAELTRELNLSSSALGSITSAVQFGFISGTLIYALFTIADRLKPSSVFLASAVAAGLMNTGIIFSRDINAILTFRFCTGFFLAGIYPVGMKIASDHFEKGLGKALGFLVGALVLGTSFPHLLKSLSLSLSWKSVIISVSLLSVIGGIMMWLIVPPGPFNKKMHKPQFGSAFKAFKSTGFRSAAFGYFGHMWELYTFWAFTPVIIKTFADTNRYTINIPLISFIVIAIGAISCVASGYVCERIGARRTAFTALLCSFICCLLSPISFSFSLPPFILFLLFWGWMVIADSPMFSTLVAQSAPAELKGTALTIVTCIGFFITIISLLVMDQLKSRIDDEWMFMILGIGPLAGLISMIRSNKKV